MIMYVFPHFVVLIIFACMHADHDVTKDLLFIFICVYIYINIYIYIYIYVYLYIYIYVLKQVCI